MRSLFTSALLLCCAALHCAFSQSVTIAPGATSTVDVRATTASITVGTVSSNGGAIYLGNSSHGIQRGFPMYGMDNNVGFYTTTGNLYLSGNGKLTDQFILTGTGNVGIGTASPAGKLEVRGATASIFVGTSSNTGGGLYLGNSGHGLQRGFPTLNADNNVGFYTTAGSLYLSGNGKVTDQFVLTTSGNVGIGTGTPGFKLDVNGNVRLSHTEDASGGNIGIGTASASNSKLYIKSNQQYGVFIEAPSSPGGNALAVQGSAAITGNLSKGGGSFKIDHPLDPENKYLYHSFVESPDMMNVYNGNITTDANGLATVTLPDYFEALNKDFRYQLTVIGTFAQAIVFEKVKGNQFKIKTDKPNIEVSWQTTGVRQDAYANKNRIPTTVDKVGSEKGMYLYPEAFGASEDKNIKNLFKPANQ